MKPILIKKKASILWEQARFFLKLIAKDFTHIISIFKISLQGKYYSHFKARFLFLKVRRCDF